jgi:hypothetical protein
MPSINRTSIISGPARITFGGQNFWSKGDVTFKVVNDRFDIDTAHFGKVDERSSGRRIEVSFEPSGRFTAALAAVLFPYGSTSIGTSIFTGTDVPLTINARDGRQILVHAAAITQIPQLRLGVTQTMMGPVTFTGICKNNTDPGNAAAYFTESAQAYPGDTGFAVADILTNPYAAAWGASAPWSNFFTEGGWTIDITPSFAEQRVDGIGIVDMTLAGLDVSAKSVPIGPTAAQILTAVAPASALGTSIASASDLLISPSGTTGEPMITLSNAALVDSGLVFGREAKRVGETEWIATRAIGSALYSVGILSGS